MFKKIKNFIKPLIIIVMFSASITAVAVWSDPTAAPPGNNTLAPVNVGADLQDKSGSFVAGGLATGVFQMTSTPAANYVMTSDVDGFGSWADVSTLPGILTNPMTTGGDIIYGGASGVPTRLGNGTAGQVLTSSGTTLAPTWETPSGGGGGTNGWVDTGTTVELETLSPADDIKIGADTVIYQDANRFIHGYGSNSTFVGEISGNFSITGSGNTGIGKNSLQSVSTGGHNVAVGYNALKKNTTAGDNIAVGSSALFNNTDSGPHGGGNIAVGRSAMYLNTGGGENVGIGHNALYNNTTGNSNVAIGTSAGVASGNLSNAIAIGWSTEVDASDKVRIGNNDITVIEGEVDWSWPSDIRIKKNIKDSDLGLDFINNLRPVSFQRIKGDDLINYGFIAQEVEKTLGYEDTSIVLTGVAPEEMKTMRYTQLIAPMVKATQEQQDQIESLEARIQELEAQLEQLLK